LHEVDNRDEELIEGMPGGKSGESHGKFLEVFMNIVAEKRGMPKQILACSL
jgi:hypothetical protein